MALNNNGTYVLQIKTQVDTNDLKKQLQSSMDKIKHDRKNIERIYVKLDLDVDKAEKELKSITSKIESLNGKQKISVTDKNEIANLTKIKSSLEQQIKLFKNNKTELDNFMKTLSNRYKEIEILDKKAVSQKVADSRKRSEQVMAENALQNKLIEGSRRYVDSINKESSATRGFNTALKEANDELREAPGLLNGINEGFAMIGKQFSAAAITFSAFMFVINQIRESVDMMKEYNGMAKEMGRSTQTVADAANEFLRMGYSAEETNELIRQSTKLATLGMIDASEATNYLISAIKGYGVEIKNVSEIIDMATELDMKYSISSGYILEAMSRTSASAKMAGSDMSMLMSMISIVGETTKKSAEVVGEAMKTMYARFGNVKINKFEDAEHPEEVENINDIERVLNKLNIALRDSEGQWRRYDDVMMEVGKRFNSLTDVEKNAIATAMFGTRQRENGIVILSNWDRILEANASAMEASGTADERYAAYTEGLNAALERLTASWENFLLSLSDNQPLIDIINALSDLVNCLSNPIIQNLLIGGVAVFGINKIYNVLKSGVPILTGLLSGISEFNDSLKDGKGVINSYTRGLKSYREYSVLATTSTNGFSAAISLLQSVVAPALILLTVAVGVFNHFNEANKEAIANGAEAARKASEEAKEIEDLKNEFKELRKELVSGNLTFEETIGKRERLSEIQNTLIKNYGLEKDGIDLVNGGLKEQIKLLDDAASKKAAKDFDDNSKEFNKALKWVNREILPGSYAKVTIEDSIKGYTNFKQEYRELTNEIVKIAEESGLKIAKTDLGKNMISVAGMTANEAIEKLDNFKDKLSEFKTKNPDLIKDGKDFDAMFNGINRIISDMQGNKQNWDNFQETLQKGYEQNAQGRYLQQLAAIEKAREKYEKALLGDNQKLKSKTYDELMKAFDEANNEAESKGEAFMKNYFDGLRKSYEKTNKDKFKEEITTGSQKWIGDALKGGWATAEDMADAIEKVAKWFGVSSDEVAEIVNNINSLDDNKAVYDPSKLKQTTKELKALSDTYNLLDNAIKDYNDGNGISISTLSSLVEGGSDVIKYLEIQNGKLVINTNAMLTYAKSTIEAAKANEILRQTELKDKKRELTGNFMKTNPLKNPKKYLAEKEALEAGFNDINQQLTESEANYEILNSLGEGLDKNGLNFLGGGGNGSGSTSTSTKDTIKEAFDYGIKALKHKLEMDLINEKEYYDELEKLNNKYFAGKKGYEEEDWKYTEEVYKGRKNLYKQAYDDELKELERLHNRKIISDAQYLEALKELNDRYYKDNPLYDEENLSNLDKIYTEETQQIKAAYQTWINLHDTYISDMDYYNKWSLGEKLNYLAQEQAAMEKFYANNQILAEEYANKSKDIAKQIYETSRSLAEQNLDTHDTYLEYVNNVLDDKIDKLRDEQEELSKTNNEREQAIKLAELEKKLAEAKRNKVLIYREGKGFVYEQNQTAVNEAQKNLDDYLTERESQKRIDAIDEEIKALEDYKNEWNDTVKNYQREQTKLTAMMYEGYADEKDILSKKKGLIQDYANSYAKAAQDIARYNQQINSDIYGYSYNEETGQYTLNNTGLNLYGNGLGNLSSEISTTQKEIGNSGGTWAILPSGQKIPVNINANNKVTDSVPIGTTIVNKAGAWTITGGEPGNYQAVSATTSSSNSSGSSSSKSSGSSSGKSGVSDSMKSVAKSIVSSSSLNSAAKSVITKAIDKFADGTAGTDSDRLALVGEEGAELRLLPKGSGVVPNPETETLMKFASNPVGFINSSITPTVSSLLSGGNTDIFNVNGVSVYANNADEFINSLKTLKNKAIQKTRKRN